MASKDGKQTVARNLKALIGKESVNAWAKRHALVQSTINRIVLGKMDPTVGLLDKIAAAVNERGGHLEGWQLMIEGYDPKNAPILVVAGAAERQLYERISAFKKEVTQSIHSDDGQPQNGEAWLGRGTSLRRRSTDR